MRFPQEILHLHSKKSATSKRASEGFGLSFAGASGLCCMIVHGHLEKSGDSSDRHEMAKRVMWRRFDRNPPAAIA